MSTGRDPVVRHDPTSPLACEVVGRGERIVLIHGFTQNRRCWGPVADDLQRDHELVLLDAPGHGESSAIATDLVQGAALIGAAAGAGTYVGYSMGGRYALQLALDAPDRVQRLVLIGASPGIEAADEREARRRADRALADHLEAVGVETFVNEWLAQPLFRGLSPAMQFGEERLDNDAAALASSLRTAGSGEQGSLWDRLHELAMPVLLVVGADDAKFSLITLRMAELIGANARVVAVAGAGHTAHLESPEVFLAALRAWLRANPITTR